MLLFPPVPERASRQPPGHAYAKCTVMFYDEPNDLLILGTVISAGIPNCHVIAVQGYVKMFGRYGNDLLAPRAAVVAAGSRRKPPGDCPGDCQGFALGADVKTLIKRCRFRSAPSIKRLTEPEEHGWKTASAP